jgi:hypothetical protein
LKRGAKSSFALTRRASVDGYTWLKPRAIAAAHTLAERARNARLGSAVKPLLPAQIEQPLDAQPSVPGEPLFSHALEPQAVEAEPDAAAATVLDQVSAVAAEELASVPVALSSETAEPAAELKPTAAATDPESQEHAPAEAPKEEREKP